MQEIGHLVETAIDYAANNQDTVMLGVAAADAARYTGSFVLGGKVAKARWKSDDEYNGSKVAEEISRLENDLNGDHVAVDSLNRYMHAYKTGKLNSLKNIYEDVYGDYPLRSSWKDAESALEPADD